MGGLLDIRVIKTTVLPDFPSGSAMEYYNGRLYVAGDDARNLVSLDTEYTQVSQYLLYSGEGKRITKLEKTDLEASVIISYREQPHLLLLGSASRPQREKACLLALPPADGSSFEFIDTQVFAARLRQYVTQEINIEGCAAIGASLLLGNRANITNTQNLLFVTGTGFFLDQAGAALRVVEFNLPNTPLPAGISSLCYDEGSDRLFFTASVEGTENALDDGIIGDSYFGFVNDARIKVGSATVSADVMVNLTDANPLFKGQKIESFCIEHTRDERVLAHMVSDNDNGDTTLFKFSFSIP